MAHFSFTGEHLEFLEGRGLIFGKIRQICIKDKLQILHAKHHKTQMYPKYFLILVFSPKIRQEFRSLFRIQ